jgi:phosphate starvation-inducible protein PhoH and related proteins
VASSTPSSTASSASSGSGTAQGASRPTGEGPFDGALDDLPDDPADHPTAVKVLVPGEHAMVSLLGTRDELLKLVEDAFVATIHVRGNEITISAADPAETARVARMFEELVLLLDRGQSIDRAMVRQIVRMIQADGDERPSDVLSEALITHRGRTIRPKTLGQKRYLDAIRGHTVTFGIGPAGTGKTYLAMGAAVQALRSKQVNRLILTRPAVEAGERLGFLPGTLHEKIDPYLKPLWDALHDMMEAEELIAHVDRGTIEVAPLAYMRGRTLNDAFIVLDEAQNTTAEQMKMFLTRIGFNSKAVVTGDISQVDLPSGKRSGLKVVREILEGLEGVAFARLEAGDVVRHHIVQRIVEAYELWDVAQEEAQAARDEARAATRSAALEAGARVDGR